MGDMYLAPTKWPDVKAPHARSTTLPRRLAHGVFGEPVNSTNLDKHCGHVALMQQLRNIYR